MVSASSSYLWIGLLAEEARLEAADKMEPNSHNHSGEPKKEVRQVQG